MVSKTLSALVVAHNEESQLAQCLETLGFAQEIVVVLDACTDGSREVAAGYTSRLLEGDWALEGERRNGGIEACTGDWILEVDADARIPEALAQEIGRVLAEAAEADGDWHLIPVNNHIGERLVRHGWGGSWGVMAAPRLFTPGAKLWGSSRIHPPLALKGPKRWLHAPMKHYVDRDFADMISRLQRYTDARAADLRANGEKLPPLIWTLRRSVSRFLKCYVMRKGYREGRWGFAIALMAALYPLISHLKAQLDDE